MTASSVVAFTTTAATAATTTTTTTTPRTSTTGAPSVSEPLTLVQMRISLLSADASAASLVSCDHLTFIALTRRALPGLVLSQLRHLHITDDLFGFTLLENAAFLQYGSLQFLKLSGNGLRVVPANVSCLIALQHLDLSRNHITDFPTDALANLPVLQQLCLHSNMLSVFALSRLATLQVLALGENRLHTISAGNGEDTSKSIKANSFSVCAALQTLDLRKNFITRVDPLAFAGACTTTLQVLRIGDNQLNAFPTAALSCLSALQELHLGNCGLAAIAPNDIRDFVRLRTLNVSNNGLTSLPDTITSLYSLEVLNLSGNQLSTLPALTATSLKVLTVSNNQLTSLPDTITSLYSLEVLNLSRNQLSTLPALTATSLKVLNVSDNRLSSLPDTITSFHSLRVLNLSKNRLGRTPDFFYCLHLNEYYSDDVDCTTCDEWHHLQEMLRKCTQTRQGAPLSLFRLVIFYINRHRDYVGFPTDFDESMFPLEVLVHLRRKARPIEARFSQFME